jgi:DNA-binding Lrp family transcriptional regulator
MERIAMSQQERDWLEWLKRARDGKMTQREAPERIGVTERRVRKLLRRMKKQGDAVVVHRLRGQACNRKLPAKTKKQALRSCASRTGTISGRRLPPGSWPNIIGFKSERKRCAAE